MRFLLRYTGPLKTKTTIEEKHAIRLHFSRQLELLWGQKPLSLEAPRWLAAARQPHDLWFWREKGGFRFIPLITRETLAVAELRITILRPGPVGSIRADIDNRMKTLFDALTMPQQDAQVVAGSPDEPVYCLLEDDALVSRVDLRAEQWLEPREHPQVDLTIQVTTRVTSQTMKNWAFA